GFASTLGLRQGAVAPNSCESRPTSPAATSMPDVTTKLIDDLTSIVSHAAAAILAARAGALAPRRKADASPVTAADEAAESVILQGRRRALPGVPVVSEEAGAPPDLTGEAFVLVDPLDGTRELLAGSDEFCINLAVVRGGRAQIGIMSSPTAGLVWRTVAGGGAERPRVPPGAAGRTAPQRRPVPPRPWPGTGCPGRREPLASRCADQGVPGEALTGHAGRERLGAETVPGGARRGRRLSAAFPREPVGRCGRRRHRDRRRRDRDDSRG